LDLVDPRGPCLQASLCYQLVQELLQVPAALVDLCCLDLPLALVVQLAQNFLLDLVGL
jgi:hypothetical protein